MNYFEIQLEMAPLEPWRDLINNDLGELNYESFVDTKKGTTAYVEQDLYNETQLKELLATYTDSCNVKFEAKLIKDQNWNEEWEKNFQPINVADKCFIHADFHQPDKDYPFQIVINPKMSFGTGHHATTFQMADKLMQLEVANKNVLDMGCGTAVLAILASKMGAKKAVAIDYDEWAYNNSCENVAKNNVANITVLQGSKELINENYELILANINLNILLDQLETYFNHLTPNGDILFSGVLESDKDKMLEAISTQGLNTISVNQKDKWLLIHAKK